MNISQRIKTLSLNNALPHAVLFEGTDRYDNTMLFAKSVVCSGEVKPCGICPHCIKSNSNNHPDIIIYNPEGALKNYKIDTIREIKMKAFILPNEADKKVFVLNDVDNMSAQSQNALLKTLEEPPLFTTFALNCLSKAKILDTIISRVTVFSSISESSEQISEEAGKMAYDIIKTSILGNELELLKMTTSLNSDKELKMQVLNSMNQVIEQMLRAKAGGKFTDESINEMCTSLTLSKILNMSKAVECARSLTYRNAHPNLNMTKLCASLRASLGK